MSFAWREGSDAGAQAVAEVLTVDGALEIPAADRHRPRCGAAGVGSPYDAVVALGCVIRGETGHYDIVAGESARALMDLSVERRIPLGNGILTVENDAQAWARARVGELNKGGGAAEAALAVLRIKRRVQETCRHDQARGALAPRGWPPCRRSIRWMSPARASSTRLRSSRRSGSAARSRGSPSSRPTRSSSADILSGVVENQRAIDLAIDAALAAGWPLDADRGGAARDPARRRLSN